MRTLILLTASLVPFASAQTDLREQVLQLYRDFPANGTSREQADHLIRLRDYWAVAVTKPEIYLPILRGELANPRNPSILLIDGSTRLLQMSDTSEDRRLALRVLARSNVTSAGLLSYFALVYRLAGLNEDTSRAALHLLEFPTLRLPIRSPIVYDLDMLLLSLLIPTDEKYWVNAAIERLEAENNEQAQRALLLLLWHGQTEFAALELKAFAADGKKPLSSRQYAQSLLARSSQITASERAAALARSEESIREERRSRVKLLPIPNIDTYARMLMVKREQDSAAPK